MNIQSTFFKILKAQGLEQALAWLFQEHPCHKFATAQALRHLPSQKQLAQALFASTVAMWQAYLYREFSKLSERQKTLQGGFRGYVTQNLSAKLAGAEEKFYEAMLDNTVRNNSGGHSIDGSFWEGRPNYKRMFDHLSAELGELQRIYILCTDILRAKERRLNSDESS